MTGCTISVPLFALALNMLVKSAEVECRGPRSISGTQQPQVRAFMDDLTVTTTSVPGRRWLLQGLERLITWERVSFKPAKSRSLVLRKGRVTNQFSFSVGGTQIPSPTEKPVKSLGKTFISILKDTAVHQATSDDFNSWLSTVAMSENSRPGYINMESCVDSSGPIKSQSPACQLCQKRGSLEHILSCCPKALGEGRYRWHHDQVLRAVADTICTGISHSKQQHPTKCTITYV